jgi:uncharacterized protein DUF6566
MIQRTTVPVNDEYSIAVVTEQMADGAWAVVASLQHHSPMGEKVIDLPVVDARYATQAEAEEAGIRQARDWLERNMPHAA